MCGTEGGRKVVIAFLVRSEQQVVRQKWADLYRFVYQYLSISISRFKHILYGYTYFTTILKYVEICTSHDESIHPDLPQDHSHMIRLVRKLFKILRTGLPLVTKWFLSALNLRLTTWVQLSIGIPGGCGAHLAKADQILLTDFWRSMAFHKEVLKQSKGFWHC